MDPARLNTAVSRIEAALARIEQLAMRNSGGGSGLTERHDTLRTHVTSALVRARHADRKPRDMSEVTLQVGGRPYTVSCADGEEDHVRHLAGIVDARLAAMGTNRVPGDAKNLLFAALILADEADEARRQDAPTPTPLRGDSVTHDLEALADRLEQVAQKLENGA